MERCASRCGWRRLHRYAIGSPSPLLPSSWVGTVSSPRAARRLVVHHRRVTPAPLFSWISTRRVACTLARSFAALGRSFLDMEQLCRFWIRFVDRDFPISFSRSQPLSAVAVCAYFGAWWRGRAEASSRGGDLLSSGSRVRPYGGSTPGATSTGWALISAPYSLTSPLRAGCWCARTLHSNGPDGRRAWMEAGRGPTVDGPTSGPSTDGLRPSSDDVQRCASPSNTRMPPALTCAMCTHSLPRVRLTLVRRPALAATGRRLRLYHYGLRLSSSVGDAAAALADAAHRRQHAAHAHVPYTCTR